MFLLHAALYSLLYFYFFLLAGVLVCKTVPFIQTTAIVTGILTMTCIAIERYQGIVFPLKMRRQYSSRRAYKMLGIDCLPEWHVVLMHPLLCEKYRSNADSQIEIHGVLHVRVAYTAKLRILHAKLTRHLSEIQIKQVLLSSKHACEIFLVTLFSESARC